MNSLQQSELDNIDFSRASSAEIDENTMTQPLIASVDKDPEDDIKLLERERRDLQDELTAVRRALPILKDAQGKDVTQKMLELADAYQKFKNENDELHEYLEQARKDAENANTDMVRTRAECRNQLQELELRCSQYERENVELKIMLENEDGRRHDESTASTLATSSYSVRDTEITDLKRMAMEQGAEILSLKRKLNEVQKEKVEMTTRADELDKVVRDAEGSIDLLQQDIQVLETENQELKSKIIELEGVIAEKDLSIKKRNEAIKGFNKMMKNYQKNSESDLGSVADLESLVSNPDNTEAILCSHLLVVLRKLKTNWKDNATLYREIKDFIRQHGGSTDIEELESMSETFYRQIDERARRIQEQYKNQLDNQNNPSILAHLRRVDQTSITDLSKANMSHSLFAADVNLSYAVNTGDLQAVGEQVSVLKKWCIQYFEKLKVLTTLVQTLLEELQDSDEGHSILARINDLHFDLNKTIDQTGRIFVEFEKAERSIKEAIEQSINQTNEQHLSRNPAQEGYGQEIGVNVSIASSVGNIQKIQEYLEKIQELRMQNTDLAKQLNDAIDERTMAIEEKEMIDKELISLRDELQERKDALDDARMQLEKTCEKYQETREDYLKYREVTERTNKTFELTVHNLKVYISKIKEAFNSIETKNSLLPINEHPEEIDEHEHQAIWESLKRTHELQNANLDYDKDFMVKEKRQKELENHVRETDMEKEELQQQISELTQQFHDYQHRVEQDNKKRFELMQRNNAILEQCIQGGDIDASSSTTFSDDLEGSSFTQLAKFLQSAEERAVRITKYVEVLIENSPSDSESNPLLNLLKECKRIVETLQSINRWLEEHKENYPKVRKTKTMELLQRELKDVTRVLEQGRSEISETLSKPTTKSRRK